MMPSDQAGGVVINERREIGNDERDDEVSSSDSEQEERDDSQLRRRSRHSGGHGGHTRDGDNLLTGGNDNGPFDYYQNLMDNNQAVDISLLPHNRYNHQNNNGNHQNNNSNHTAQQPPTIEQINRYERENRVPLGLNVAEDEQPCFEGFTVSGDIPVKPESPTANMSWKESANYYADELKKKCKGAQEAGFKQTCKNIYNWIILGLKKLWHKFRAAVIWAFTGKDNKHKKVFRQMLKDSGFDVNKHNTFANFQHFLVQQCVVFANIDRAKSFQKSGERKTQELLDRHLGLRDDDVDAALYTARLDYDPRYRDYDFVNGGNPAPQVPLTDVNGNYIDVQESDDISSMLVPQDASDPNSPMRRVAAAPGMTFSDLCLQQRSFPVSNNDANNQSVFQSSADGALKGIHNINIDQSLAGNADNVYEVDSWHLGFDNEIRIKPVKFFLSAEQDVMLAQEWAFRNNPLGPNRGRHDEGYRPTHECAQMMVPRYRHQQQACFDENGNRTRYCEDSGHNGPIGPNGRPIDYKWVALPGCPKQQSELEEMFTNTVREGEVNPENGLREISHLKRQSDEYEKAQQALAPEQRRSNLGTPLPKDSIWKTIGKILLITFAITLLAMAGYAGYYAATGKDPAGIMTKLFNKAPVANKSVMAAA